ncbi:hypothetical protein AKL17_2130 [Frigidibacter mobilis]|uniref:Uncharacterized protein n=1 Tax=Frigidibacter mobilis TaxID=1335048 RepID=A0A159Z2U7_9RHOB|nr:hypothetical protein AKL17_2130 [Frigidibacter mobilis]
MIPQAFLIHVSFGPKAGIATPIAEDFPCVS